MSASGLLKCAEVAAELAISPSTLRGHVRREEIEVVRIGWGEKRPRYRFRPEAVAEFKQRQRGWRNVPCRSTAEEEKANTATTSSWTGPDLQAIRAARAVAKLKK